VLAIGLARMQHSPQALRHTLGKHEASQSHYGSWWLINLKFGVGLGAIEGKQADNCTKQTRMMRYTARQLKQPTTYLR
jgi:hypothetical protein